VAVHIRGSRSLAVAEAVLSGYSGVVHSAVMAALTGETIPMPGNIVVHRSHAPPDRT
jgi:hypothetical protein